MQFPSNAPAYTLFDWNTVDEEAAWRIHNVHDPSIFKDGDDYYVFSTDIKVGASKDNPMTAGLHVRRSPDLIHWEWVGYALDGVPIDAYEWTKAKILWAPEVFKFGDTYYLYYVASQFGTNQSFIGVAISSSVEGPWHDQGEVIKTTHHDESNAIDPNIILDRDGNPWMSYGSFFGGIYVCRLNPENGKLLEDGYGTRIACRDHATTEGSVEGPYIMYHPTFDMYYLFVSYDFLGSNYNIRVGRSKSITGPYVDTNGYRLDDTETMPQSEIGLKIVNGYRFGEAPGWLATGHNSVLLDDDGKSYIVHHARAEEDKRWSCLHIRQMLWTEDGWPVVLPERYAGETVQKVAREAVVGVWEHIELERQNGEQRSSRQLVFRKDGTIQGRATESDVTPVRWQFKGEYTLSLQCHSFQNGMDYEVDGLNAIYSSVMVVPAWDWENNCPTLVYSGLKADGTSVWGKQIKREHN